MFDPLTFNSLRGAFGVRAAFLAAVVIQLGLGLPAWSQDSSAAASRAISEKLPLFTKNHCETHKNPANQLFCADPALTAAGAKLAIAIEERLNRLADRGPAIEENAQWIRDRNQSCGIFGNTPVRAEIGRASCRERV